MCLTLAVISVKLDLNTHKGKLEEKDKILSFKQNKEAYPYREKKGISSYSTLQRNKFSLKFLKTKITTVKRSFPQREKLTFSFFSNLVLFQDTDNSQNSSGRKGTIFRHLYQF